MSIKKVYIGHCSKCFIPFKMAEFIVFQENFLDLVEDVRQTNWKMKMNDNQEKVFGNYISDNNVPDLILECPSCSGELENR